MGERRGVLLNAFSMNCVSHIQHGLWIRDDTRQREFNTLDPWMDLARLLDQGGFDALFLADVAGVYDTFRGSEATSVAEAMQIPANDPMLLIPAMASVTSHLGFAVTHSILQSHPFELARKMSTLDHLTRGRVGWNIVTGYLPNAAQNHGFADMPDHDERYDMADEYLEVCYKLWEGSWEEDAVVCDRERRMYADPTKVHRIDHVGRWYDVPGPHLCEPSPQRTPLLFQAGSSDRGRRFAATHAEGSFITGSRRGRATSVKITEDLRAQAVALGRHPDDVKVFQAISPIVGGTEAEARRKEADLREQLSVEGSLAHMSGNIGADLGTIDLDAPLREFRSNAVQGFVRSLVESAPDDDITFRDLMRRQLAGNFLVGSPEQIADELEAWVDAGIDGFNVVYSVTPGTFADFVEGVVPVLRERGLVEERGEPTTLRRRFFGQDRLSERHPAAAHRRR